VTQKQRSLIALGIVALLVAGAAAVNRLTAKSPSAWTAERTSLAAKADLALCPNPAATTAVPHGLPAFTFPCLGHGPSVNLGQLRGPLVVNIWAGTCPPCRLEAPLVQQFYAAAAGRVGVLGVVDGAYPAEDVDDALDAARGLRLHYPSVFDASGKLVSWSKSGGIPATVLIDASGKVAYVERGQLKSGQLSHLVRQYLGVSVDA